MNNAKTENMMNTLNENWTDCLISDEERLDKLQELFPNKFRKQDILDTIAEAKKSIAPTRTKADKVNLFGEQPKVKAVTPDVSAKTVPKLNVTPNNKL